MSKELEVQHIQPNHNWQPYLKTELSDPIRNPEVLVKTPFKLPLYNPKEHKNNIDATLGPNQEKTSQDAGETVTHKKSRPEHALINSSQAHKENATFGTYASHIKFKNEEDHEGNISTENMSAIWKDVYGLIAKQRVFIMNPFHEETSTIRRNIGEAMSWVGPENVYAISTGESKESEEQAELTGIKIKRQEDILEAWKINRSRLSELAGIPDGELKGKGITMLAGVLDIIKSLIEDGTIREIDGTLKLKEQNNDPIIMFHDTDITNPTEYSAIPLVLLPFTKENKKESEVIMSMNARTGEGRNNEPIMNESNNFANDDNVLLARYGMELQPMVWPLTGERALRVSRLLKMPFANGMGIETSINAYSAGVNASEYSGHIAHVIDIFPKIENSKSLPEREYGTVIFPTAMMQREIGKHILTTKKFPNEFNLEDIKSYNNKHGGKEIRITVPPNRPGSNIPKTFETNYMLPSIKMMHESGIINLPKPKNKDN
jgi:hypothetical protein